MRSFPVDFQKPFSVVRLNLGLFPYFLPSALKKYDSWSPIFNVDLPIPKINNYTIFKPAYTHTETEREKEKRVTCEVPGLGLVDIDDVDRFERLAGDPVLEVVVEFKIVRLESEAGWK